MPADADHATPPADPTAIITADDTPKHRPVRSRLSPERLDRYVEVLALTGSHFEAARVATPYANPIAKVSEKKGGTSPPSGYSSFLHERKSNPDFARRCDEAVQEAIGRAESELARRMMLPTERPTVDKAGTIIHVAKDYRNADLLLSRFLARHRPQDWIERKAVDSNVTVTNANSGGMSGASYSISIGDIEALSEPQQAALSDIIRTIEEKKSAVAALAAPTGQMQV